MLKMIIFISVIFFKISYADAYDDINLLLKNGSDDKAFIEIDRFIEKNHSNIHVKDILKNLKPLNNRHSYYSYFLIQLLKTKLLNEQNIDEEIYKIYRYYITASFWHDYYEEVNDLNIYMKNILDKKIISKDIKQRFTNMQHLSNALYLICKDDAKGYEELSKLKPLSKDLIKEIHWITARESKFTKNLTKFAKILGMKKEQFGSLRATQKNSFFFNVNAKKIYRYKDEFTREFFNAYELLINNQPKHSLKNFKKLINKDPKKFKHLYKKHMSDTPYYSFFDITLFNAFISHNKSIDLYARDTAVGYVFFNSKNFMADELEKFIKMFKQYTKNEKENLELIAIFEANILLLKNQEDKAYEHLKQQVPYSAQSIALIKYFSPFEGIPLYISHEKLLNSMQLKNIKLHSPVIPQEKKFYFTTNGEQIK